jgi:DNA end-binding protein Ku
MWRGVVSFGMVSIPVRLYLATESHGVSFRQLCPDHLSPIKYRRWCAAAEHEVSLADTLRGYEVGKDQYVIVDDSDLDNLPLPAAKAIEIQEFVPADQIDGALYYKSAYYLEPEDAGRKPYFLLKEALQRTSRKAIAKLALRDREHLCVLQPGDGVMLLNTLNWPDEIRTTVGLKGLEAEPIKIEEKELSMATLLIEQLAGSFDPGRYHDNYREALQDVVDAKLRGEQAVEALPASDSPKVMDLMEALKASVEAARVRRLQQDSESGEERPASERRAS